MSNLATTEEAELLALWLDDELVRAEFDAIIAAEYPGPATPAGRAGVAARRSRRRTSHRTGRARRSRVAGQVEEAREPGRERSPPCPSPPAQEP